MSNSIAGSPTVTVEIRDAQDHPYPFVVLNACESFDMTMCQAFGIQAVENAPLDFFQKDLETTGPVVMHMKCLLLAVAVSVGIFTFVHPAFTQTWTQTSAPITNWSGVASSADGSRLVAAVSGGRIYTSTDSGAGWTATGAPSTNWSAVASSADGTKLVAVVNGGGIHTSPD